MKTKFSLILALLALQASFTSGQTTAVPGTISYQGRVYTSAGALLGAGTPVNRTVIFRIWDSPSATLVSNLLYSESQTVTISEGEFSVLVGNGVANTTQTFGYSETAKHSSAAPAVNLADVFNGASRYLSVTVANAATIATSDSEITPRQQIVSSAFAFRSKFAETLGTSTSGSSLRVLDNGNIGIGTANPPSIFTVTGSNSSISTSTPQLLITDGADTNERLRIGVDNTGSSSGFLQAWKEGTGAQSLLLNPNGGTVGIGMGSVPAGSLFRLDIAGGLRVRTSIHSVGNNNNGAGEVVAGAHDYIGVNGDNVNSSFRGAVLRGYGNGTTSDAYNGLNASNAGVLQFQNCNGFIGTNGSPLSIGANSTEVMRITTDARVGVGTSAPVARFGVRSAAANSWPATSGAIPTGAMARFQGVDNLVLDFGANSSSGAWLQSTDATNLGTNYNLILNPNGANVGIGIKSPATRLDVNGGIRALGGAPVWSSVGYSTGFSFGTGGDTDGGMFSPSDGILTWFANGNEKMRLTAEGRIGIGTATPTAGLHVTTVALETYGTDARMVHNGAQDNNNSVTANVAIRADGVVRGGEYHVVSDERIKNIIGKSNSLPDLQTLLKIEITDYDYKDVIAMGNRPQKKVIAQQVEKVFPTAVRQGVDTVPDIFRNAPVKNGWVELATDLKKGERVSIIGSKNKATLEVLEVADGKFKVELTSLLGDADSVFVFGREVSDFRSVDYDAIAMLNVSATQELNRKIERLEAALAEKDQKILAMEASTEARLMALEKRLSAGESATRTISLQHKKSSEQ
jgi:hypothetical protein